MKKILILAIALVVASCGQSAIGYATEADGGTLSVEEHRLLSFAKATLTEEVGSSHELQFRNLAFGDISVCGEYALTEPGAAIEFDKFRYAAGNVMRRTDHERHRKLLLNSGHTEAELKSMLDDLDQFWKECQRVAQRTD
ncbi:hypothetical protein [Sphingopyxis sp. R3-92]|uniref:hypothetical protein n=1 Tax=Sphingopyxis sp. R3-92 TaxID=3158553 RepID=UPI003EE4C574